MAEPQCHYCDRPAEAECPTCGRLYCAEHGEDVCLRCLAPEAAAPTAAAYRGAVLALMVGTAVSLFLVIRPPESESASDAPRVLATSTPSFAATATPTAPGSGPTAGASATQAASAVASVAASPTAAATTGARTYTVQAGDTLFDIAIRFNTTVEAIVALNPGVGDSLAIGTILQLPAAQ